VPAVLPTGAPLVGRTVRLDPLTETDLPELFPLLADPEVYASGYVMHRRPETLEDALALARERFLRPLAPDGRGAGRTAYAVRLVEGDDAGTLVGTSTLMEAHLLDESIHLGSTLYGRRWWGTRVNPEAKLLLLAHCFEDCGFGRVKIQTDLLNTRSQEAIARLGARREGVLRREQRREDGTFRDTVVFSILMDEWAAVRAGLTARLEV
jgi:RimJ/RimL family protein N-acetyltransferase